MAEFIIDGEALKAGEIKALQNALEDVVNADLPLVLELLFLSEEEIRALNARERNVDRVTDVLSFPTMELVAGEVISSEEHGECVEEDKLYLGSVVICKKRAEEQAEEYGHSLAREIGYLTVHGALHCLGYDHETEEDRAVMRAEEERIMKKLGLGRDV